jgi:hypothetical protein
MCLGYALDDRRIGVRFPAGANNFSLPHAVQTGSGSHPVFYRLVPGALPPELKWPGREADHSPVSSIEVKNVYRVISPLLHTSS